MPISEMKLIKNALEYVEQSEIRQVPKYTRGIYVLYTRRGRRSAERHHYDVVYVGMARGQRSGIAGRLRAHRQRKGALWTHFSAFEVWDNISEEEVRELEGLTSKPFHSRVVGLAYGGTQLVLDRREGQVEVARQRRSKGCVRDTQIGTNPLPILAPVPSKEVSDAAAFCRRLPTATEPDYHHDCDGP